MSNPAIRIDAALDGILHRLGEARMIVGYGPWVDGRVIGRRLQVSPRDGRPAHLLIATAAPIEAHPDHTGPCPAARAGDAVVRIFDPICSIGCPERCGGAAPFLARRLTRAIAAATGESPDRIARIIANAPPMISPPRVQPLSLIDVLFA